MKLRTTSKLTAAAAAGTLLLGGAAAVAATSSPSSPSHHGRVEIWVSPSKGNSATQKILITGAIGDYGKAISTTKSGKPNPNGSYVHIVLHHGTFHVNAVALNKKFNKTEPTIDKATCSAWADLSGTVTLFDGTGSYAGITGKIKVTTAFAVLLPRYTSGSHKGQCNLSNNAAPIDAFNGQLTGVGTVSFG